MAPALWGTVQYFTLSRLQICILLLTVILFHETDNCQTIRKYIFIFGPFFEFYTSQKFAIALSLDCIVS